MRKLKPYSVLLLYPDYIADAFGQETYFTHVDAVDPAEAIAIAQAQAFNENSEHIDDTGEAIDFFPLLCLAGHHQDQLAAEGLTT